MVKVAMVIGHNQKKQGAYSKATKQCEYAYYTDVVNHLKTLDVDNIVDVYTRPSNVSSYGAEMRDVLSQIEKSGENYQLVIELHYNAAGNPDIKGAEVLAYEKSKMGIPVAREFLSRLCKEYDLKNRGIKGIKSYEERGAYGIMKSEFPYILIEPFFCSNEEDDKKFADKEKFAKFLLDFIKEM